jgi:hypothetical protein
MATWYFNVITVEGNADVVQLHKDIISEFVKQRNANTHDLDNFKFTAFARNFLSDDEYHKWPITERQIGRITYTYPSYDEINCKWAFLDERIRHGNWFKIISASGIPFIAQDNYLYMLSQVDPDVIVKMNIFTCPEDMMIRYVQYRNSELIEICHGNIFPH